MATISGQGVDGETTQRILDFLNRAQTAADIAGKEPQAGPVHDDPRTGYGDQIADQYDGFGRSLSTKMLGERRGENVRFKRVDDGVGISIDFD